MTTKHTPGPWRVVFSAGAWLIRAAGQAIAQIVAHDKEDEANARLLAVAPELLGIVQQVDKVGSTPKQSDLDALVVRARALLARINL